MQTNEKGESVANDISVEDFTKELVVSKAERDKQQKGELVFNSNDISIEWDGKNSINGVYAYRIDIIDMNGKSHYFEGEISLIR